ncbi:MAG: hypothetical protein D6744_08070 [Planctomycetota bacterium]|nr:MAG: hypothetical protein D6744_08070 [Planctomycetota bacterium]
MRRGARDAAIRVRATVVDRVGEGAQSRGQFVAAGAIPHGAALFFGLQHAGAREQAEVPRDDGEIDGAAGGDLAD